MNEIAIVERLNGKVIEFLNGEEKVNLTTTGQEFGERVGDFLATKGFRDFQLSMAQSLNSLPEKLVTVRQGGVIQGTWAHRRIALKCAAWLSSDFEVWMLGKVEEIFLGDMVVKNGFVLPRTYRGAAGVLRRRGGAGFRMSEDLQVMVFRDHNIEFLKGEEMVNLTSMCLAFGERVGDFLATKSFRDFQVSLAQDLNLLPEKLVTTDRARGRAGTWAHRRIALKCAA